ncbi:G1 family glutamic endopeptidase [Nocardia sp. CDC153]|uniref:G1 family glutamic endopeptidase n=1 Tax=Nocardia sp. CDC153 TaxID=3112167 RepID=UPI002DBBFFE2|nr:G1 family glutamic endopeptidase [Nocardia sp. CDC153]MEC3957353.1 G1 family glutamic endopeptidase [Nocardia sp. CDC153]
MAMTLAVSAVGVVVNAADAVAEVDAVAEIDSVAASNARLYLGNWAGYVVKGDFHEVSATWVQPEIDCSDPGLLQRVVPWVGLNGAQGLNGQVALPLMQTGVESLCASDAAVYAALPGLQVETLAAGVAYADPRLAGTVMNAGSALSNALGAAADGLCSIGLLGGFCRPDKEVDGWWESYPDAPVSYDDVEVRPGDVMHSVVNWDGGRYLMTLENRTAHWTRTTTVASTAPVRTAEIVVEGHLDAALPGFAPITFSEISIDGQPLSAYDAQTYGIPATNRLLAPGPVDGASFTIQ